MLQEDYSAQQLTKKERKEVKRQEKLEQEQRLAKQHSTFRFFKIALLVLAISGGVGFLFWYNKTHPPSPQGELISRNGIHWHAKLGIVINGKNEEIPSDIGIGVVHAPIHTHDATGTIHMEMDGRVTKDMIKLGEFFKIWDKHLTSECIFNFCSGPEGSVKMFVAGKENTEFGEYMMQDGDAIEIRFE
ncbi:MAG: hypothetical protein AAB567_00670 [Patescibacteria group bacterium]